MLEVAAACLLVTALLAYFNHRFIGLPITVGVMTAALLLVLSLPAGHPRNLALALTYCIVVFSILGQLLTIGKVVRRW